MSQPDPGTARWRQTDGAMFQTVVAATGELFSLFPGVRCRLLPCTGDAGRQVAPRVPAPSSTTCAHPMSCWRCSAPPYPRLSSRHLLPGPNALADQSAVEIPAPRTAALDLPDLAAGGDVNVGTPLPRADANGSRGQASGRQGGVWIAVARSRGEICESARDKPRDDSRVCKGAVRQPRKNSTTAIQLHQKNGAAEAAPGLGS